MNRLLKNVSLVLVLCLLFAALPAGMAEGAVDPDLTCTITLGNWPADTAPEAEKALFEGYKATMARLYPNVTLVPDYYSYTLSNYVPMAKGNTAPSIFQPPFTDPQLLISQHLVGDVTDALEAYGVLDKFSPSYMEMLADENGRIYGLPRDGYVLGMHINIDLFRQAGLIDEEGLTSTPRPCRKWPNTARSSGKRPAKRAWCSPPAKPMAAGCSPTSRGTLAAWAKTPWNIRTRTAAGCAILPPLSASRPWSSCATSSGSTTS